jgi:hypothetical protein
MADSTLKSAPAANVFTAASLRAFILGILIYWGAHALLLPVTTSDCQVYNLGRLLVAERAGFWQAEAWNSIREVTYPWTFDAAHYPFLKTGWGFGLPSFAAFLGLLVVIFQLIAPKFGEQAALWSILTLLAMPTLMLQATTTKNDLIIVFGAGCWIYSLVRFQRNRNKFFLFAAALSLAFIAGSKNLALGICVIAVLATVWLLRRQPRNAILFALFLIPLLFLFGSIETYVLSWGLYHHPFGPKLFVTDQLNGEGTRGAVANFLRYYMANISTGNDGIDCHSGFPEFVQKECRVLLGALGLQDAGCRRDFKDANLPFLKDGSDSGYDFGLVGCLALFASSCILFRPACRDVGWSLSAVGFVAMIPVCLFVAWAPWNVRYFCLSFALFGINLALLVFGRSRPCPRLQLALGVIIVWSAISLPLHCGQRRPFDLWNAIFAREDVSLAQRRDVIAVYNDVVTQRTNSAARWFLVASENSWILPFLQTNMDWELTPQWEQVKARLVQGELNDSYALILNGPLPKDLPVAIVKKYQLSTFVVRILPSAGERFQTK